MSRCLINLAISLNRDAKEVVVEYNGTTFTFLLMDYTAFVSRLKADQNNRSECEVTSLLCLIATELNVKSKEAVEQ